ncbi:hypothetical protein BDD12DRAFT_805995 [Trichophaea hybrida]|nr:hypothetical protein BDD12DRAFT_805995 [Trichophaea hybrida]
MSAHRSRKPRPLSAGSHPCIPCNRSFHILSAFYQHYRTASHLEAENHFFNGYPVCEACNLSFRTQKALSNHLSSPVHIPLCSTISCKFCSRRFSALSALALHFENAGCRKSVVSREMVDMAVMAADDGGLIVGTGEKRSGYLYFDSDSDEGGEVFLTPDSFPTTPRSQSPELDTLVCPLCPAKRGPFIDRKALERHQASPAHEARMYHRPGAKSGRGFSTLSSLLQYLEAAAEVGKEKGLAQVVDFMAGSETLADVGFEVKLIEK